jgi:hypothetical protein
LDAASSDDARTGPEVPEEERETVAWDAHQVWRERVREARHSPPTQRVRDRDALSPGWDPLETWRDRVLRHRRP